MAKLSPNRRMCCGFGHLVSPSGTKKSHEVSDLADFGQVPVDVVRPVLVTLAERRIRARSRGRGIRFKIFHDVSPGRTWSRRAIGRMRIERRWPSNRRRSQFEQMLAQGPRRPESSSLVGFDLSNIRVRTNRHGKRRRVASTPRPSGAEEAPEPSLLLASDPPRPPRRRRRPAPAGHS